METRAESNTGNWFKSDRRSAGTTQGDDLFINAKVAHVSSSTSANPLKNTSYLIVGDYCKEPSEGMQVLTKALVDGLRDRGCVVRHCRSAELAWRFLGLVVDRPAAIVFSHGPGSGVLFWSGVLKRVVGALVVWLAPRPDISKASSVLRNFARVDGVLAARMDADVGAIISRSAGEYRAVVHGVDRRKFKPEGQGVHGPAPGEAQGTRNGAGELPTFLHVGHVRRNRGLDVLCDVQRSLSGSARVVVVASQVIETDEDLLSELADAGVTVEIGYVSDLPAYYRAAALYLFPVPNEERGAVDLPLSVLEALACGTPVLSTPFGALPECLAGVPGVRFSERGDFSRICEEIVRSSADLPVQRIELPASFDINKLPAHVAQFVEEIG